MNCLLAPPQVVKNIDPITLTLPIPMGDVGYSGEYQIELELLNKDFPSPLTTILLQDYVCTGPTY